ncbi:MAG: hypothetical protein KDD47_14195 [Acidobacteria bacterium]|nr:hypothetical protein [Acidobacteriota bacterium]
MKSGLSWIDREELLAWLERSGAVAPSGLHGRSQRSSPPPAKAANEVSVPLPSEGPAVVRGEAPDASREAVSSVASEPGVESEPDLSGGTDEERCRAFLQWVEARIPGVVAFLVDAEGLPVSEGSSPPPMELQVLCATLLGSWRTIGSSIPAADSPFLSAELKDGRLLHVVATEGRSVDLLLGMVGSDVIDRNRVLELKRSLRKVLREGKS